LKRSYKLPACSSVEGLPLRDSSGDAEREELIVYRQLHRSCCGYGSLLTP